MQQRRWCLWFVLLALVWLWLDLAGLLFSVLSTYFYFGWAGTPLLPVLLFLLALFSFSGPVWYSLLFRRWNFSADARRWLALALAGYLLLTIKANPHVFAWTTILTAWWAGIGLVAILHQLSDLGDDPLLAASGLFFGILFYLLARILGGGLAAVFLTSSLALCVLLVVALLPLLFPSSSETLSNSVETRCLGRLDGELPPLQLRMDWPLQQKASSEKNLAFSLRQTKQGLSFAFGLLLCLSLGMHYNIILWSSKTPHLGAAYYLASFGCGVLLGLILAELCAPSHAWTLLLLLAALVGAALSLSFLLQPAPPPSSSFQVQALHLVGATSLTIFWYFFVRRFLSISLRLPEEFPAAGLQLGLASFLLILAPFLLLAKTIGFWIGLVVVALLLALVEGFYPPMKRSALRPFPHLLLAGLFLLLLAPSAAFLLFDTPRAPSPASPLSVITTNVRYGWTDDYRFDPALHRRWLRRHSADLIGFQEINKGHISGAYLDLFHYYRKGFPQGWWRYGDAHFGFGNALYSRYPIRRWKVLPYDDSDMLRRSCLWAEIAWGQRTIEVFVTHLSHHKHPNPVRQGQAQQLLYWLRQTKHPWILMGDFNAQPHHPEIQAILPLAHPIFRQRPHLLHSKTAPSRRPRLRIDYIFFSSHFSLLLHQVHNNKGTTDHRPVQVLLDLPTPPHKGKQ